VSAVRCGIRYRLYERWDGKGLPQGLAGDAVNFPVRLVDLAQDAICHAETKGVSAMIEVIGKRCDGAYQPMLADRRLAHAGAWKAILQHRCAAGTATSMQQKLGDQARFPTEQAR
jgi:hypothetical protein